MKVANAVHEAHPWVVRRIAPDFDLLDVWALPVEGAREDFGRVLDVLVGSFDPRGVGGPARALFAVRDALGRVFRWDAPRQRRIPGSRDAWLRDRLPDDLAGSAATPALPEGTGFRPLYRTADEWAAEISNGTVHGVLHLAWAEEGAGRYRARLAVYVKPRGRAGRAYLRLIEPFRHYIVYPALLRHVGAAWERAVRGSEPSTAATRRSPQ